MSEVEGFGGTSEGDQEPEITTKERGEGSIAVTQRAASPSIRTGGRIEFKISSVCERALCFESTGGSLPLPFFPPVDTKVGLLYLTSDGATEWAIVKLLLSGLKNRPT